MIRGWIRNKILIYFYLIPRKIATAILKQYNEEKKYQQGQLINYFIKNRFKYLMENMGDFTKLQKATDKIGKYYTESIIPFKK